MDKNVAIQCSIPFGNFPINRYYVILEQVKDEELATTSESAQFIDELYDIDPCVDTYKNNSTPEEKEKPSREEFLEKAKKFLNVEDCKRRRAGDYYADIKVIRSHINEKYVLRLNVGKIISTVVVKEDISINLDVKDVSYIELKYPVVSGLKVSWIGQSFPGNSSNPIIKQIGNILFWGTSKVSGTIRAEYKTSYDLVTVDIPGVPKYPGSINGDTQQADLLCFYHSQVYRLTIDPPSYNEDDPTIKDLCGLDSQTGSGDEENEEPPISPPDTSEYGCIQYSLMLGDPNYYKNTCCIDPPFQLDGCDVWADPNPGGKILDQDVIDRLTKEWNGPIEFIGLGPRGNEGCGKIYKRKKVHKRNCCDDVVDIQITNNSADVIPAGGMSYIFISGGEPPYTFTILGEGVQFYKSGRELITDNQYVIVVAASNFCGNAVVSVKDGCSSATTMVRSDKGKWTYINASLMPPEMYGMEPEYTPYGGSYTAMVYSGKYRAWERQFVQWWGMPTPGNNTVQIRQNPPNCRCDYGYCGCGYEPWMTYEDYLKYVYGQVCTGWQASYYGHNKFASANYPAASLPPYTPGQWDNYGTTNRMAILEQEGTHHYWVAPSGYNTGLCGGSVENFTWVTGINGSGLQLQVWSC